MEVETRTIVESRLKTLLGLAFFVALTVFAAAPTPGGERAWAPWLGVIGGFGIVMFGWLLVRPMKLRLDGVGFELSGGFYLRPKRVAWGDVDRFVVVPGGPRSGFSYVQYTYPVGHGRPSRWARLIGVGQAPGSLPSGWPMTAPELAQLLNDCCWEAIHTRRERRETSVTAAAP